MFTAPSCLMHYEIDDVLRDPSLDLVNIVAPRGHAKSSIACEIYAMWHIFASDRYLYEMGLTDSDEQTSKHILLISKTQREAKNRLATIKMLLGNKGDEDRRSARLFQFFGDWGEQTARVWTNDVIELKDGTVVRAIGTGQPIRGAKAGFKRPDLIIVDDPEDEKNTITAESMMSNLRWLEQAVVHALTKTGRRKLVVIGTPINAECMVVKLHEAPGWHSQWYKINYVEGGLSTHEKYSQANNEFHTYQGVIWPEVVGEEVLKKEKQRQQKMGLLSSFYRESCCHIIGDEDQQFKPEYERYYDGELKWDAVGNPYMEVMATSQQGNHALRYLDVPLRVPVAVTMAVDPASSLAAHADKTAVIPIAMDRDENIYILPYIHGRFLGHVTLEKIVNLHNTVRANRGVMEVAANFKWMYDDLHRIHGLRYLRETPVQRKKGEGGRIESLQPRFAYGQVFMRHDMTDLVNQLRMYPRGKDDLPDALELAVRYAMKPRHEITWVEPTINDDPYDYKSSYNPSRTGRYGGKKKLFDPKLA